MPEDTNRDTLKIRRISLDTGRENVVVMSRHSSALRPDIFRSMRAYLKILLLFALTAGAAWLASRILVPDAVPVADSEQPQWYLGLAFVLKSIELIGLGGMALVLVAGLAARLTKTTSS